MVLSFSLSRLKTLTFFPTDIAQAKEMYGDLYIDDKIGSVKVNSEKFIREHFTLDMQWDMLQRNCNENSNEFIHPGKALLACQNLKHLLPKTYHCLLHLEHTKS